MRTKDLGDIGLKLTSISSTDRERKKALYIIFLYYYTDNNQQQYKKQNNSYLYIHVFNRSI